MTPRKLPIKSPEQMQPSSQSSQASHEDSEASLQERSESRFHSQFSSQQDAFDSVNDFRAKNKHLLDRLSAAETFIKEYEPMLLDQKRLRKEATKAIIFNLMNGSGLHVEDLAKDELDLAPGKSEEDS
jgi:hypothetical protein